VWNLLESAPCLVTASTGLFGLTSQDRRPVCCRVRPKEGKTPRRARAAKLPRRRCPQASHPRASVVRLPLCLVCLPLGSSSQQFSADSWDLTKQLRSFLMTLCFPPMPLGLVTEPQQWPSGLPVCPVTVHGGHCVCGICLQMQGSWFQECGVKPDGSFQIVFREPAPFGPSRRVRRLGGVQLCPQSQDSSPGQRCWCSRCVPPWV